MGFKIIYKISKNGSYGIQKSSYQPISMNPPPPFSKRIKNKGGGAFKFQKTNKNNFKKKVQLFSPAAGGQ